jgi:diguanylate cyclase (GGDEF)-like protein
VLSDAMLDLGEERASSKDRIRGAIVATAIVVCGLAVIPVIGVPLGVSYPIFSIVVAVSISAIAVTAVLLWAQARVTRSFALSVLAIGYALTASIMVPYLLFYRGLWPQLGAFFSADPQTSSYLYLEWHAVFICGAIAYFLVRNARRDAEERPDALAFRRFRRRLGLIAGAVFLATVPAAIWVDNLPALAIHGHYTALFSVFASICALAALAAISLGYAVNRFGSQLDLWLAVAALSMCADLTLLQFSRQFAVGWYFSRLSFLLAACALLFVLLFQTANIYAKLAATAERLRNESLTDALTGLANRRCFDVRFGEIMRDCGRLSRPVALLMIDIDNFKAYNDMFGHLGGDECLRAVAAALQNGVGRARDLVARTGGEEMAVVLSDVDIRGAVIVADRLRAAVQALAIAQGPTAVHRLVTISIGVSSASDPASTSNDALVAAADAALYRAKSQGRNCVVEAPSGLELTISHD